MRPQIIDPATPRALQQSDGFATALRAMGRDADLCNLNHVGQCITIERKFAVGPRVQFTSRGPVWRPDTMPTERVAALRDSSLNIINAAQEDHAVLTESGFRQIMTGITQATLPLFANPDDQMRIARGKWRNAARKMARCGMRIGQPAVSPDLIGWLLSVDALQQRRKRFRALPARLTRALIAVDPTNAHLFIAKRGNTTHAAMLFLRHGTTATYHIGWTDQHGRTASAHHAILMHASHWLARHGVQDLDLGHIDTQNAPGLARFKIGTGARLHRLGGTWLRLRAWRR